MRLGWGLSSAPDAAQQECCVHSTLHGVVFAIFCPGPALHRRRDAMPGPGHEIVSASRLRDESIQLQHIMLYPTFSTMSNTTNFDSGSISAVGGSSLVTSNSVLPAACRMR